MDLNKRSAETCALAYERVRSVQFKFLLRTARQEFTSTLNKALLEENPDMDFDADWCFSSPSSMLGRVDDVLKQDVVVSAMRRSSLFRSQVRKAEKEFASELKDALHKFLM